MEKYPKWDDPRGEFNGGHPTRFKQLQKPFPKYYCFWHYFGGVGSWFISSEHKNLFLSKGWEFSTPKRGGKNRIGGYKNVVLHRRGVFVGVKDYGHFFTCPFEWDEEEEDIVEFFIWRSFNYITTKKPVQEDKETWVFPSGLKARFGGVGSMFLHFSVEDVDPTPF